MTPTTSLSLRPCKQRQRRRMLLVGGFMVPAVALGGVLVAMPANADPFSTKQDLHDAFGQLSTGGTETFTLQTDATAPDATYDVQEVPAGTHVTIDLNGHDLSLDQLKVGDGADLTIQNAPGNPGTLTVGASPAGDAGITFEGVGNLVIDGADVTATGSAGNAGIGSAANDGGHAQSVVIKGDAQVSATGGAGAAGIGGGAGSSGEAVQIRGTARVTAAAGAPANGGTTTVIGGGEGASEFGSLSITTDAKLTVASGSALRIPASQTVVNAGELALVGDLAGSGTLENTGSITGSGTIGGSVHVTRNNYLVSISLNGGTSATTIPSSTQLYTANFTALSGYTPTRSGYHFLGWKAGDRTVTATTDLHDVVDSNGRVALVAQWSQDVVVATNPAPVYAKKGVALPSDAKLPIDGDGFTVSQPRSGNLPEGVSLSATGGLTGTPTRSATSTFTVDITQYGQSISRTFRVTVGDAAAITTSTLPVATVGRPYTATRIDATGGGTVTLSAPNLPAGLTLNTDGTLTGTPTGAAGTITVHFVASSEFGSTPKDIDIRVGTVPAITTLSLPTVKIGQAYSQQLAASGEGTQHFRLTQSSPALPAGLSLAADGTLSGTYTGAAASSTFTVRTETEFGTSTDVTYTLSLGNAPSIRTTQVDPVVIGTPFTRTLTADGDGTKTFTLASSSAALPSGVSLASDGTLSGTYSGGNGSFTFSADVTSTFGTDTKSYTVATGDAPAITTANSLPVVKIGQSYGATVTATGFGVQAFSLVPGDHLPAGLTISDGGAITGTPTGDPGDVSFGVTVSTPFGTDTKQYTVHVGRVPVLQATPLDAWTTGTAHSQPLPSSGTGVSYAVTAGALPTGITLSAGGTLSGTVSAHQDATFTVTATSIYGTATRSYVLHVGDAPRITTTRTSQAVVDAYYEAALATVGDLVDAHYTVITGALPAGLHLDEATGVISGYATDAGSSDFTVKVTTAFGQDTKSYTLRTGTAPAVATTTLPAITVGSAYSADLTASGTAAGSATFRIVSGALPTGLSLDSATGRLTGTVNAVGDTTFTVATTTDFGTAQRVLSVTAGTAPAITAARSAVITVGQSYSQALAATGSGLRTWSVDSGTLPDGLALNPATGAITGSPTGAGSASVTLKVTSPFGADTRQVTLRTGTAPSVTTESLPAAVVGTAYSADVVAAGTASGSATFAVTVGALPAGLTLNTATGHLSGTPTAAGDGSVTITATTDFGTAQRVLTISAGTAPAITAAGDDVLTTGRPYSQQLAASGTGAKVWTVSSGTLPDGLTLNPATGVLSGTPTAVGSTTITVKVTTPFGRDTHDVVLRSGDAPAVTTASLPPVTVGTAYSADLGATGSGSNGATFALFGSTLPAGLTVDAAGHLRGTVTAAGDTTVTFRVTTAFGTADRTLTISAGTAPEITTTDVDVISVGRTFSQQLAASGTGDKEWTVTNGALPDGLELQADGVLTGTAVDTGDYDFTVTATSPFEQDTKRYTGTIGALPAIWTLALPGATVGTRYSTPLAATGSGTVTLAVTGLPAGLDFDAASGVLSGTPTAAGSATVTVAATNRYGTTRHELTLAVAAAAAAVVAPTPITPAPTTPAPTASASATATPKSTATATPTPTASATATATAPPAPVAVATPAAPAPVLPKAMKATASFGHAFSMSVAASSTVAVRYSTTGDLPKGLSLNAATGVVSGTPKEVGSFVLTVKATSSTGSDTEAYTVVVPEIAPVIDGSASTPTPAMGKPVDVTVRGLKKGERWHIKVDGKTVEHGIATKAGDVKRSIALPKTRKDHAYSVKVTTSRTVTDPAKSNADEFTVTALAAKKTLKVRSEAAGVKVTGLAAKERVSVSEGTRLIAQGHADENGEFTFAAKTLKAGKHKLVATGRTDDRTGRATIAIKR